MSDPIRILPMSPSDEDFHDESGDLIIEEVQQSFFVDHLAKNGTYNYVKRGLVADGGTIVLFQYGNSIIAHATLTSVDKPAGGEGKGKLHFRDVHVF